MRNEPMRRNELPETCFSILPSSGQLIIIRCGDRSYRLCCQLTRFYEEYLNKLSIISKGITIRYCLQSYIIFHTQDAIKIM